jgi:hypothetical protein
MPMQAGTMGFVFSLSAGLLIGALVSGCNQGSQQGKGPSPGEPGQPAPNAAQAADDESLLVGDWRGESKVQAKNTAAKDEVVVWHIAKGSEPGKLIVTADKIVNGKSISMGALEFKYDREKNQIVCENERGIWKLTLKGNRLEGALTLRDQTVLRHVALEKTRPGKG